MDCDGPKHILIHDSDGSLTSRGAGTVIVGRAEFQNRYRAEPNVNQT